MNKFVTLAKSTRGYRCTFGQALLLLLKYSSDFNTAVPEYPAEEKAPSGLKSAQSLTCL